VLIEINLAPGAAAANLGSRRLPSFNLPALPAFQGDVRMAAGILAALLALGSLGFGYWRMAESVGGLESQIRQEVADSARYASTIALVQSLQARQDTIVQRIGLIRGVDTRRYVWPHLLDEISVAVPAYTWLTQISSTEVTDSLRPGPVFTVQGNAGSTQALTRFMKNLEASAFVRDVTLITSEQEVLEGRTVQRFSLEARFRVPEPEAIRTLPIVVLD
jgi:Tfp pilus assembly protein PilN